MNRWVIPAPVSRPPYRVSVEECTFRVCAREHEVILAFPDPSSLEAFLTALGEAWARWDEENWGNEDTGCRLQCRLPF